MNADKIRRVREKQRYLQSVDKLVHMKMPYDRITSVIIPGALMIFTGFYTVRGIYDLAHGTGKIEG